LRAQQVAASAAFAGRTELVGERAAPSRDIEPGVCGLCAENGALRRPHHIRPRLADSVGRRSATNREQRCAALGAVALPAGTTVGQGHLPRVGDGDLLAADASALWVGFRCLWVLRSVQPWPSSIILGRLAPVGAANQPRRICRAEHRLARLVGGLGLVRGIVGQLSRDGDERGGRRAHTITAKDLVARRDRQSDRGRPGVQGAWSVVVFGRASAWQCRAASLGQDPRAG
jgi:hypothetical protein